MLGVEFLAVLQGHLGHLDVRNHKSSLFDGRDDLSDMLVAVWLDHGEGSGESGSTFPFEFRISSWC